MTYKETLFFIGKCLTITHEEHNRLEIEQELKNGNIDWDAVVKVSTAQYVFPALYCNLKRANFLSYLPEELVNYMIHITDLNRERNQQIIEQAKEINELLLANNITPIFLKGTGFLLQDFYEDIAERMVGDIDFLVSEEEFKKTINVLKKDKYHTLKEQSYYPQTFHRHYKTIVKKNKIGGVEVHSELLEKKSNPFFNYTTVSKDILTLSDVHLLSYQHQLTLTILAKQINDLGYAKKNVQLRNLYDVFLLSTKTDTSHLASFFPKFKNEITSFLALAKLIFSNPTTIFLEENSISKKYLRKVLLFIEKPKYGKIYQKKTHVLSRVSFTLNILFKAFYDDEYRRYLTTRISSKNWIKEKIFGFKPTP